MDIQIQKADPVKDMRHLCQMDWIIFDSEAFIFPEHWNGLECFLVLVDGERAGSFAFRHNSAIARGYDDEYPDVPGSLYIVTTGLLPEFQRQGIGSFVKKWQIDYAKSHDFEVINTHCRAGNRASYRLNTKYGFVYIGRINDYYDEPTEDAIVLELRLKP